MKKFPRIFAVILALAVILSSLCVVAFATEDEPVLTPASPYENGFEDKEGGTVFYDTADKKGIWNVGEADNGNKYLIGAYAAATGTNGQNWDINFPNNNEYGVDRYPIFAMDIDVRSTTGAWIYTLTVRPDLYGVAGYDTRLTQCSSTKLNLLGLKGANEWNHITLVAEYLGDGVFDFIYYLNGARAYSYQLDYKTKEFSGQYPGNSSFKTWNDLVDEDGNLKYKNIRIDVVSFYPPTDSTAEEVHYDNLKVSYYPTGYTADQAAAYVYNDSYKLPYGYTEAKIGDVVYDDVDEALLAAKSGDTVKLTANASEELIIKDAIIIDANVYDADGNATGSYYTFDYASPLGYVATENAGIYTFAIAENNVTVNWDPACDGECDCYAAFGGHKLTATTVVPVGQVPAYFGATPEFGVKEDYTQHFFIGWSYENDGTVDELVPVESGEVTLYPVYETKVYEAEYKKSSTVTYYESLADALTLVTSKGGTVKLLRDVDLDAPTFTTTTGFTLDLNGYDLRRCFHYGNVYEATKDESGNFVFGTENLVETIASANAFFSINTKGVSFVITSTAGQSSLYNSAMSCDTWVYNGEVVKRTSNSVTSSHILYLSWKNNGSNLNITISNLDIYSSSLWYQDSASATGNDYTVDRVKFYRVSTAATEIMSSRSDQLLKITITDSLFYSPAATKLFYLGTNNNKTAEGVVYCKNSDFIKVDASFSYNIDNRRSNNVSITFDDCRAYDIEDSKSMAVGINGTVQRAQAYDGQGTSKLITPEGYERVTIDAALNYTVPKSLEFAVDKTSDVNALTFDFPTKSFTVYFDSVITKPVEVNWVGADGNIIKTEQMRPGVDALTGPDAVVVLEDDEYRNLKAIWVDAPEGGKAINETLGYNSTTKRIEWQESYSFYAVGELNGEKTYVGGIKSAMFNISFLTSFKYNVYFPVNEALEILSIEGFENCGTVSIDGEKYVLFNYAAGTTAATEDLLANVSFTANGEAFTQTFALSAVRYADMILAISDVETERLAVGNMVRFLKEARLYSSLEVSEKLDQIISAAGVADYAEIYDGNTNIIDLKDYLYSASYVIYNGAASYKFTLNDASYADLVKFYHGENEISFKIGGEDEGRTFILLDAMRVYDIIDTLTIKISGTELSATYSMLDNIEALPDCALVKALYEFGLAAEAYKAYLEGEYPTA